MYSTWKRILRFKEFLKESLSILDEYEIDEDYPWSEEIGDLIDKIIEKVNYLKSEYNYKRHRFSDGFELNIKIQRWPDMYRLAKKYNLSEEEINSLFNYYLEKSLYGFGEDVIKRSKFFEDWSQTGKNGGWLVLELKQYFTDIIDIIDDTENKIYNIVSDLNYYTNKIDDDIKKEWNKLRTEGGSGFRLLKRNNLLDDEKFKEIIKAEEESESVKKDLKYFLDLLDELEKELEEANEKILEFWENIDLSFEEEIKNQIDQIKG